ncbi:MAG: N-acetyltransferase [archaeon]|nr:N-acetyltransferase [archaeon]
MVNIRRAEKKDLKEISNLFRTESSKKPYNDKWTQKIALKEVTGFFKKKDMYVAIINKKIVGFIVSSICSDNKKKAYIDELWLKPEYQGKGIGKSLVKFIEDKYKKKGIKILRVVSSKKARAFGFYKKVKFKELKELVFMEKKLK